MPAGSILRNYANVAYPTYNDGGPLTAAPRQKFQFVVEFKSTVTTLQDQLDKLKLIIRSAELPSFQFDTQVLNQYNRKRVIQTRANFQPVTITFNDTRDNKWQNVFKEYLKYYYKDGRTLGHNYQTSDTVQEYATTDNFGLKSPKETTSGSFERYFFSQIRIHREYGGLGAPTQESVTLFNPVITTCSHDTLDYSDSGPVIWSIQFAYEGITYDDSWGERNMSNLGDDISAFVKNAGSALSALGGRLGF